MTSRRRRLSIVAVLAVLAVLLAACGSGQPITRPTTRPAPTPARTPSAPPPAATIAPAATCDPDSVVPGTDPIRATLEIRTATGSEEVPIEVDDPTTAATADPGTSSAPVEPVEPIAIGAVLAGTRVAALLFVDEASAGEVVVTAALGKLTVTGTGTDLVEMTMAGNAITFEMPDLDGDASLFYAFSWTVDCVQYSGTALVSTTIIPSSVAAGCPTTGDGLLESVGTLRGQEIQIGPLDVPIGILGWTGRWIDAFGIDEIPPFATWDPNVEIDAAPGSSIVIKESLADLQLQSIRAPIYLRAEVDAYFEPDSVEELVAHTVVRRSPGPLGRVGIPVPLEVGSYVMEVQGVWQTSCLQLETYAVVSVEVR